MASPGESRLLQILEDATPTESKSGSESLLLFSLKHDVMIKMHAHDYTQLFRNSSDVEIDVYESLVPILYRMGGEGFVKSQGPNLLKPKNFLASYPRLAELHTLIQQVFPRDSQTHIHFLVLDLSKGRPLHKFLRYLGKPVLDLFFAILLPIVLNLIAMEAAGLRHNDLHAGNIYIEEDRSQPISLTFNDVTVDFSDIPFRVKLLDWDRATCTKTTAVRRNLVLDVGLCSTQNIQCNDFGDMGRAVDLFAVCFLLCYDASMKPWGDTFLLPWLQDTTNFDEITQSNRKQGWLIHPLDAQRWHWTASRQPVTPSTFYMRLVQFFQELRPQRVRSGMPPTLKWYLPLEIEQEVLRLLPQQSPQQSWQRLLTQHVFELKEERQPLQRFRFRANDLWVKFWEQTSFAHGYSWPTEAHTLEEQVLLPFFGSNANPEWVQCVARIMTCPILAGLMIPAEFWSVMDHIAAFDRIELVRQVLLSVWLILPWPNVTRSPNGGNLTFLRGPYAAPQGKFPYEFRPGLALRTVEVAEQGNNEEPAETSRSLHLKP